MGQRVFKVQVNYSTFSITPAYTELSESYKIMCVEYDAAKHNLMILTKIKEVSDSVLKTVYTFKLFDLYTDSILIELNLENQNLIGRLKSGLFSFIDGHIYFSNDLIKIRYDLIYSKQKNIKEES
mgnify:CR=1 FL=1